MDYGLLLALHSWGRWFVLISIVATLVVALVGWQKKSPYGKLDNQLRLVATIFAHVHLLLALVLYYVSPVAGAYWNGVKSGETRYFAMEHSVMMILAVVLLTIGGARAKRAAAAAAKHRQVLIFFGIAVLIILVMIPWPGNPMASRPLIR